MEKKKKKKRNWFSILFFIDEILLIFLFFFFFFLFFVSVKSVAMHFMKDKGFIWILLSATKIPLIFACNFFYFS